MNISTSTATTIGPSATAVVPCQGIPNLDYSGLNGSVCAVSIPPAQLNITTCCSSVVRVANNCTQFCEADAARFGDCVNDMHDGFYLGSSCEVVNGTSSGNGSNVNGTVPSTGDAIISSHTRGMGSISAVLSIALISLVL